MANFPLLGSSEWDAGTFFEPQSESFLYPDDYFSGSTRDSSRSRMKKYDRFLTGMDIHYFGADEDKLEDPRRIRGIRDNVFRRFNDFHDILDNNLLSKDIRFSGNAMSFSISEFEDMQVFFSTTQEFELTNNSFCMDWPFFFNFYRIEIEIIM